MGGIVVVGSLNADLSVACDRLPAPGETVRGSGFAVSPGGKGANQAVAAARLGAPVALVGAVGGDAHGTLLLEATAAAGVDVSQVRRVPGEPTGVAVVTVDAAGENTIVATAGANAALGPDDVAAAAGAFEGAAAVCLCLEVGLGAVEAAALAGRGAGAAVVLNPSPSAPLPPGLLDSVDVLLLNRSEASAFLDGAAVPRSPEGDWSGIRTALLERGARRAVVTLGAAGAVVLEADGGAPVPIPPVRVAAVDTTGAGDAFLGALATRLAAGDGLPAAARFASAAAALSTTRRGAQASYPDAAEVARWSPTGNGTPPRAP